ncbi:MAG: TIR domain-containing protein [Sulfuricella sp.]|nr:TIR domain-containing protein [Sulfuricella sp.]
MTGHFEYDVFLSHHHADKPRVRRLAERLKDAGLKVWFDEWIVRPGDIISLKVEEGLEQSRVLLLCISPAALASHWVALERGTAIHRDPANLGRRFVPLLLDACELPDSLAKYQSVDYRDERPAAWDAVVNACRSDTVLPASVTPPRAASALPINGEPQPLAVLERTIKGHSSMVNSIAVSPDGTWLVSGSHDTSVGVWDMASGECLAKLSGHEGSIESVAISPDGNTFLSASHDKSLHRWDSQARNTLAVFNLDGWPNSIQVLPDNRRVLLGLFGDSSVELRSLDPAAPIWRGNFENEYVNSVALDREGRVAVSGHRKGTLGLWDIESGDCLARWQAHSGQIHSVQITRDGRFALSGSFDSTIRLWNLATQECTGTLEGHQDRVLAIALSPDDSLLASAGYADHTVRLWDWDSGACLQTIELPTDESPVSTVFSPDGSRLVVGTSYGFISIYRIHRTPSARPADTPRRYVNAKVVLLGEGTVGKTSLAHRLIDDQYVIKDRTHGMNVWPLALPAPETADSEREALLWDLAGQEDYRLIHQLFLDQTALALLLVNSQKDDLFAEAGSWLKALDAATQGADGKPLAERLLILSQNDGMGAKLGRAKIEQFCATHGFADWLETSAKSGEHCSDGLNGGQPSRLKQLIAAHIPWDRLPWTSTPQRLATLKNAVLALRDTADVRLLRFAELAQRLEQALPNAAFSEAEARTAVSLLANHGLVHPLQFGDLVLLRPDLLNGYAAAVIRAARRHRDEIGCVAEADVYGENFDFSGVERLARRDEELLLRALVQLFLEKSLCIAEDTPHGRHLVFPSQYRHDKDTPKNPDLFVAYTFSGEWQTVWTTLVVRLWYSQEFGHRELWRNAAEFATPAEKTLGLLVEKEDDGAATIGVYFDTAVADEMKVIFIEYVHRHLERYTRAVTRDRRYICASCGTPIADKEAVRLRLAAGKDFIYCQRCDAKVPLIDFIEQRLKSDPVAQKILAMEETASRELDNQALEQILTGHMMAISGEANQIYRELTQFDYGIDGEIEFKDNNGEASGKKIYVQLKSGNSYLRERQRDGSEVFDVKDERHLEYWINQPVDVYLVIRQKDELRREENIRWMNVTQYLKARRDKTSRQIIFSGEKLDMHAVWRVRDGFFER